MDHSTYISELEVLKAKLGELEQENKNLHFELYQLVDSYNETISKIPDPILIFNKNGKVQFFNDKFKSLLSFKSRETAAQNRNIEELNVAEFVDNEVYQYIEPFISRGTTLKDKYVVINDFTYNISIHSIKKEKLGMAIFRMVATKEDIAKEVIMRLQEVIETNFEMVQKIGSLMGEEVSKNTETLSSIIRAIK